MYNKSAEIGRTQFQFIIFHSYRLFSHIVQTLQHFTPRKDPAVKLWYHFSVLRYLLGNRSMHLYEERGQPLRQQILRVNISGHNDDFYGLFTK